MRFSLLLLGLTSFVVASPSTFPTDFDRYAPRRSGIDWQDCPGTKDKKLRCGRFEVPMDYANEGRFGKASLAVIMYPAQNEAQPKLGTLFLNPGGPGKSGVEFLIGDAKINITEATDGRYDLVSWDPRGVGATYPRIDCFDDASQEKHFWNGTIPHAGFEAQGEFTSEKDLQTFYRQGDEVDQHLQVLSQLCLSRSDDTLLYVGTAATVRDMVALHDYLQGPNGSVNYWGFSHGTIIGSYFVNMFPGRVGRVVLDGVMDPVAYASELPHKQWAVQASACDGAFNHFTELCAEAGPCKASSCGCALAKEGHNQKQVQETIEELMKGTYLLKRSSKNELGSAKIRKIIHHGMYEPTTWPNLAERLQACDDYLKDPIKKYERKCLPQIPIGLSKPTTADTLPPDYSFQAISCGDAVDPSSVTTRMVFDEIVRVTHTVSSMFGPSWGAPGFYCHKWPVRVVERYTGPWNGTLTNKILVLGNTYDPITPLVSAEKVASTLKDSAVLIETQGWGHTSLAMHSSCTLEVLKGYFVNNTKPTTRMICATDQIIFKSLARKPSLSTSRGSGTKNGSAGTKTAFLDPSPTAADLHSSLNPLVPPLSSARNSLEGSKATLKAHIGSDEL